MSNSGYVLEFSIYVISMDDQILHMNLVVESRLYLIVKIYTRQLIPRFLLDGFVEVQSTLVFSNSKGLSEILRDIRTSTYQSCRIEEKIIRATTLNKNMCNWTLEIY